MHQKLIPLLFCLLILAGCASTEAYKAYTESMQKANAYRQQPGIKQVFDNGKLVSQDIVMPDQGVQIAQIKDSEWAKPIGRALEFGMVGSMGWAITHELSSAIQNVQPNISGSYNQPGGNMAGGDVSVPTTTTTTTETITGMEPVPELE